MSHINRSLMVDNQHAENHKFDESVEDWLKKVNQWALDLKSSKTINENRLTEMEVFLSAQRNRHGDQKTVLAGDQVLMITKWALKLIQTHSKNHEHLNIKDMDQWIDECLKCYEKNKNRAFASKINGCNRIFMDLQRWKGKVWAWQQEGKVHDVLEWGSLLRDDEKKEWDTMCVHWIRESCQYKWGLKTYNLVPEMLFLMADGEEKGSIQALQIKQWFESLWVKKREPLGLTWMKSMNFMWCQPRDVDVKKIKKLTEKVWASDEDWTPSSDLKKEGLNPLWLLAKIGATTPQVRMELWNWAMEWGTQKWKGSDWVRSIPEGKKNENDQWFYEWIRGHGLKYADFPQHLRQALREGFDPKKINAHGEELVWLLGRELRFEPIYEAEDIQWMEQKMKSWVVAKPSDHWIRQKDALEAAGSEKLRQWIRTYNDKKVLIEAMNEPFVKEALDWWENKNKTSAQHLNETVQDEVQSSSKPKIKKL